MQIIAIQDNNGHRHIINLSQITSITQGLQPNSYLIYCRNRANISISKEMFNKLFKADWIDDRVILEREETVDDNPNDILRWKD